jgi:hypothetical protein
LGHSLVFPSWLEPTNQLYSLQMDVRWCDRVWVKLGYLTKLGFVGTGITKIFGALNFKIMIHAHPQKNAPRGLCKLTHQITYEWKFDEFPI